MPSYPDELLDITNLTLREFNVHCERHSTTDEIAFIRTALAGRIVEEEIE